MAILFGTTADGETLPVEVNEFGQLIAEGLPGQAGPPGPPGVGELPPDPFEGAILGWKDNTLAWLGGAVPIPEGTYGPIVEYANGVLTLETDVVLPYLTAIFLSDEQGERFSYQPVSSPITDVVILEVTDKWSNGISPGASQPEWAFNANPGQACSEINQVTWTATAELYASTVNVNIGAHFPNPYTVTVVTSGRTYYNSTLEPYDGEYALPFVLDGSEEIKSIKVTTSEQNTKCFLGGVYLDSQLLMDNEPYIQSTILTLTDGTGLDQFQVGDVIQDPYVITEITSAPSISTNGGTWAVGERVYGPTKSGDGTVQTTVNNAIVLREDNGQWLPGRYITAPDQRLAARYAYEKEIKNKTEEIKESRL